jgi:hypothetical protein
MHVQASPVADTILAQAIDGSSAPVNYPAAGLPGSASPTSRAALSAWLACAARWCCWDSSTRSATRD